MLKSIFKPKRRTRSLSAHVARDPSRDDVSVAHTAPPTPTKAILSDEAAPLLGPLAGGPREEPRRARAAAQPPHTHSPLPPHCAAECDHGPHLARCDFEVETCAYYTRVVTILGYFLLVMYGHVRDFFGKIFFRRLYRHLRVADGLAPLTSDFESLYQRRLYRRIRDCWNRPITGVPGRRVTLLERVSTDSNETFQLTGRTIDTLNLSSYNYLGFAQAEGPVADAVVDAIRARGVGIGATRTEGGTLDMHLELEALVARFLGVEDALVFNMGFATNALMIPALAGPGSLIISDQLNHTSLVFGARFSGAAIRVFRHNDTADLERVIRDAIAYGQPRTHRPWTKILVVVEGLYSMEGSVVRLPELIALRKRYGVYLFVDEAHSVGALGPNGRGVCDFWGVSPRDVDVHMGTFTKSFGAAGGYIAGSRAMVSHLRAVGIAHHYAEPMPPPIVQQVASSMRVIMGEDGTDEGRRRLDAIHTNALFFMRALRSAGFVVYGDEGSPIVPALIFQPGKIAAFSHEALARGLAVVVVGFPATPIDAARVRFCVSAAHTREDLEDAVRKISEIGDVMLLKFRRRHLLSWTGIF